MRQLFIQQNLNNPNLGIGRVLDVNNRVIYHISGDMGRVGDELILTDLKQTPLAKIVQEAGGLVPKFRLQVGKAKVGSFGLSLQFRELLFISRLNWLIFVNTNTRSYSVVHVNKILLKAQPIASGILKIDLFDDENVEALTLIIAFLERRQQTGSPLAIPRFTFPNRNPQLGYEHFSSHEH